MKAITRTVAVALCTLSLAAVHAAELLPWDAARVTELAKQLEQATRELEQAVRQLPPPGPGAPNRLAYFRLAQQTRQLRREAGSLSRDLQRGAGWEQTLPSYESMMVTVRDARQNAQRVLSPPSVEGPATRARETLNQLKPFFDASAEPLEPVGR